MFEFVPKAFVEEVPRDHLLRRIEAGISVPLLLRWRSVTSRITAVPRSPRGSRPGARQWIPRRHASFRKQFVATHENISFGGFLLLGLGDEACDHSSIRVFFGRSEARDFSRHSRGFNEQLRCNGPLSDAASVSSTLVRAAVSSPRQRAPSQCVSDEAFAKVTLEDDGVSWTSEALSDKRRPPPRFGTPLVGMPVVPGRTELAPAPCAGAALIVATAAQGPAVLGYRQHVLVDRDGFIFVQRITHATTQDPDAVPEMLCEGFTRSCPAPSGRHELQAGPFAAAPGSPWYRSPLPSTPHATSRTATETNRISPHIRRNVALNPRQEPLSKMSNRCGVKKGPQGRE